MSALTYEIKTSDPLLGRKLWRVSPCKDCEGRGHIWYAGCGDQAATCRGCDGAGETGRYRDCDLNGTPYGPWRTAP